MIFKRIAVIALAVPALALAACGGGGYDSAPAATPSVAGATSDTPSASSSSDTSAPSDAGSTFISSAKPLPGQTTQRVLTQEELAKLMKPKDPNGLKMPKEPPKSQQMNFPDAKPKTTDARPTSPRADSVPAGRIKTSPKYGWCNDPGGHVYEAWSGFRIEQYTYYCWNNNGVTYVGNSGLTGWVTTEWKLAQVSWSGIDKTWTECHAYDNHTYGYCDMNTQGHFTQKVGPLDQRSNVWTTVRMYYQGYARCANQHDNNWATCWNTG